MTSTQNMLHTISAAAWQDEKSAVTALIPQLDVYEPHQPAITAQARAYITTIRHEGAGHGVEGFMQEFGLDSAEGVTIMCLAEALLRIPDAATANALIEDSFKHAHWEKHLGHSDSVFINASAWGLLLTGGVVNLPHHGGNVGNVLGRLVARVGEPIIRTALKKAIGFLGKQFVLGRTIEEAITHAASLAKQGYQFSYDMLGEGARSHAQAKHFADSYRHAINTLAAQAKATGDMFANPGISIKLSALHPRYEWRHAETVMAELFPTLLSLIQLAAQHHISVSLDAEETHRLDLQLDIFQALCHHSSLQHYAGLGFVVQAYQKRAIHVLDFLLVLAKERGHRMPIRLVKGAYWDSEMKWAQAQGLPAYPVFTRKSHTDISYLACAAKMLANPSLCYPQFATHNALTVASIQALAGTAPFEFQRLYGMGDGLYSQVVGKHHVRIYAPVGSHVELLPYLIRRLLENGANSSFIHHVSNPETAVETLLETPTQRAAKPAAKSIPLPRDIYGDERTNPEGICLGNRHHTGELFTSLQPYFQQQWQAHSAINGQDITTTPQPVVKPYDTSITIGQMSLCTQSHMMAALEAAHAAFPAWQRTPVAQRASMLRNLANALDAHQHEVLALLMQEAGKTLPDAIAEWREAIDFCLYYAHQAEQLMTAPITLPHITGEQNVLHHTGKGVFVCIAPWNFPLAIFLGQIAAALVTGNTVLAKPAEQTPLIAAFAIHLCHQAGIPTDVLHLLIGKGSDISNSVLKDARVAGVAFTGSTATAQRINLTLAQRQHAPIASVIAETGGQNAMIVDSTCLIEQAVDDIINSAFYSAGQRCSALRVLYVQHDIADALLALLHDAMQTLYVGNPEHFSTDISAVIDDAAYVKLSAHITRMTQEARLIASTPLPADGTRMVAPHAFEISHIDVLKEEIFGPILHVIRYSADTLEEVLTQINSTGYGLTCGLHSRINARAEWLRNRVNAGNIYINRSMTGAVVGQQPFGGMGQSGTGFKAGGPHYLLRFVNEQTVTINTTAMGGNLELLG